MNIKRIMTFSLLASVLPGHLLGMKKGNTKTISLILKEKIERMWPQDNSNRIIVYDHEIPVCKEFFDQCELYKTQRRFEHMQRNVQLDQQEVEIKKIEEKWDITPSLETVMPKEPKNSLKQLVSLLVSKKFNPFDEKHNKKTLYKIIKITDLLQNKRLMHACTPGLMKQLIGEQLESPIFTFKKNSLCVGGIASLPGGKGLLAYSDDGTIRVWNSDQKNPIATFKGHNAPVKGTFPLPCGKKFLSYDKTIIKLWNINPLTFEQITLVFDALESKENFIIEKDTYWTFTELPEAVQKKIKELEYVTIDKETPEDLQKRKKEEEENWEKQKK